MKDEYTTVFYDLVQETQSTTGYELPVEVEAYVVMLLASKIDKPNIIPVESFAQSYLALKQPYRLTAKELGDTCLFVTSVFPSYGRRYGLDKHYYSNIGKSSYSMASECLNIDLFEGLSTHFDILRSFIDTSINKRKSPQILG